MCSVTSGTALATEREYYLYDAAGRVNYVIRQVDGDVDPPTDNQRYTGTQLWYNTQSLVWLSWKLHWQADASGQVVAESVQGDAAMEYRYDSARARYRVQPRDPRPCYCFDSCCPESQPSCCALDPDCCNTHFLYPYDAATQTWPASAGIWSDYDGDAIHGDYTISIAGSPATVSVANTFSHEAGLAQTPWTGGSPSADDTAYYHANLIGTTERMTDVTGAVARRAVYTAFGEPVFEDGSIGTRYGYAGAWGYQAAGSGDPLADLGWLQVGARYYDPSSGRFVQRDPIGIRGGLNTYAYCSNNPVINVDPNGECFMALGWVLAAAPAIITTAAMIVDLVWDIAHSLFPNGVHAPPTILTKLGRAGLESNPEDSDEDVLTPTKILPPITPNIGVGRGGGRLGPILPMRPNANFPMY